MQELPPAAPRRTKTSQEAPAKSRRKRTGSFGGNHFLAAHIPFLITRVLPALVVLAVFFSAGITLTRSRWAAKESAKLAERLWSDVLGASIDRATDPYVRGELAIVETQSEVELMMQNGNLPQQWINNYLPPPLNHPDDIGSVIVVEWKVFADTVRDSAGRALTVQGADGPAMLKKWRCKVKLVDRKRRSAVYEANLEPPDKSFETGDKVLITPSTRVTPEQLAVEFEKIRKLPRIALDGEPPAKVQPKSVDVIPDESQSGSSEPQ